RISEAMIHGLADLIATRIRPMALAEDRPHFKARACSASSEETLAQIFGELDMRETQTLFYTFPHTQPNSPSLPVIDGLRFTHIDRALLASEDIQNITPIRSEINWMWPSEERFYEHGFG